MARINHYPKRTTIKRIKGKHGLFCCPSDIIDSEVLNAAGPSLKVVATFSARFDHIDLLAAKVRGIRVGHALGVMVDSISELAIALLLATTRRICEANEAAKLGICSNEDSIFMCGQGLANKIVGIVGFDCVGQEIARKIKAFNVKQIVYYCRRRLEDVNSLAMPLSLNSLIEVSDFIIMTLSHVMKSDVFFNEEMFDKMKPNAVFINVSQRPIEDYDALHGALVSRKIWAAGLDVALTAPLPIDHPLLSMKNCIILPHLGGAVYETMDEMADVTARNILAAIFGGQMPGEVL